MSKNLVDWRALLFGGAAALAVIATAPAALAQSERARRDQELEQMAERFKKGEAIGVGPFDFTPPNRTSE